MPVPRTREEMTACRPLVGWDSLSLHSVHICHFSLTLHRATHTQYAHSPLPATNVSRLVMRKSTTIHRLFIFPFHLAR